MADMYTSALSRILLSVEKVYGLDEIDPDCGVTMLEIKAITERQLSGMSKEEIIGRNRKAAECIIPLPFISMKLKYFGYIRLSFSKYPGLQQVVDVLLKFTNKKTVTMDAYKELNRIIILLNEIDKKQIQLKAHLAYRYLRMFVILLLNNNMYCASIFADLILNQLIIKR